MEYSEEMYTQIILILNLRKVETQIKGLVRIIKDASEVKNMQTAADLASKAHMKAMVKTQPGLYEYNIAAEFDSVFKNENSEHSYPPIVAGGENACILHYNENNKLFKKTFNDIANPY